MFENLFLYCDGNDVKEATCIIENFCTREKKLEIIFNWTLGLKKCGLVKKMRIYFK